MKNAKVVYNREPCYLSQDLLQSLLRALRSISPEYLTFYAAQGNGPRRLSGLSDRSGNVKHSCASIGKTKQYLNYEPVVSFEEDLKRTVEFCMEHGFNK